MGSIIYDQGPVHVRGAIKARFARIIWEDGTLYVANRNGTEINVQTAQTSEPVKPDHKDGFWRATLEDGTNVSWSQRGCATCGSPYKGLGQVPRGQITG